MPAYDLVSVPLVSFERRDLAMTIGNNGYFQEQSPDRSAVCADCPRVGRTSPLSDPQADRRQAPRPLAGASEDSGRIAAQHPVDVQQHHEFHRRAPFLTLAKPGGLVELVQLVPAPRG
jgi:hypothetical protein